MRWKVTGASCHLFPLRFQPSLTCLPIGPEALVVFLKFGFGLAVRYLLPGRQRMERPAFSFVGDLLLGGPFWFDHLVFALSEFVKLRSVIVAAEQPRW